MKFEPQFPFVVVNFNSNLGAAVAIVIGAEVVAFLAFL